MAKRRRPTAIVRKDGTKTLSWGSSTSKRAEPFQHGNEMAVRTGHRSERHLATLAAELVAGLLAERPDLDGYPEALHAWARAEARVILLSRGDFMDAKGVVINAREVARFERLATEARSRLGLDPRSEAELHKSRAEAARTVVDLDAIRRRGREALQRRAE